MLLRRSNAKKSLQNLGRERKLRMMRLRKEIKALENPRSAAAKKIARRLSLKSSEFIAKQGMRIGKHLSQVAKQQDEEDRKKRRKK